MDVAVGDELGARADRGENDQVAAIGEDALARAHRFGENQGRDRRLGRLRRGRDRAATALHGRVAAALQGGEAGAERCDALLGGAVLNADGGQLAGAQLRARA